MTVEVKRVGVACLWWVKWNGELDKRCTYWDVCASWCHCVDSVYWKEKPRYAVEMRWVPGNSEKDLWAPLRWCWTGLCICLSIRYT